MQINNILPRRIAVETFENEKIDGMMTRQQLWEGFDPAKEPFEVTVEKEWEEDGVQFRSFYFTSQTVADGKVRVYAVYGSKPGKNRPSILHIHGGGQTANPQWVAKFAKEGYAVFTFDWGGYWDHKNGLYVKYPQSMHYCNHQLSGDWQFDGNPDMSKNSWYEWLYICLRSLALFRTFPEVDPENIGIFGISMGGSLVWNVAGLDHRIKAAVPIYGAGWNFGYADKYSTVEPRFRESFPLWATGMAPQTYAQDIQCPVFMLSATNDQHGKFDRVYDTLNAIPQGTVRRESFSHSHCHHIEFEQFDNIKYWFDKYLKQENLPLPETPQIDVRTTEDGLLQARVRVDKVAPTRWIRLFFALEQTCTRARYWQDVEVLDEEWVTIPIMHPEKYCFIYASVRYENGLHLSSEEAALIPADYSVRATAEKSDVIYSASEGSHKWTGFAWPTDPLEVYMKEDILFAPIDGGVSTVERRKIVTHAMNDPRFSPDGKTEIVISFEAQHEADIVLWINSGTSSFDYKDCAERVNLHLEVGKSEKTVKLADLGYVDGKLISLVVLGTLGDEVRLTGLRYAK